MYFVGIDYQGEYYAIHKISRGFSLLLSDKLFKENFFFFFLCKQVVVFDNQATPDDDSIPTVMKNGNEDESSAHFLVRILRYLDTPQYLRRRLFPMHKSLRFVVGNFFNAC